VAALGVEMHLHRNAGVLQRDVVDQRLVDAVHVVVLVLEDERRRRLAGEMGTYIRVQLGFFKFLITER